MSLVHFFSVEYNCISINNQICFAARLDKYKPKTEKKGDVEFEFHIHFDDAFKDVNNGRERHANEYAEILVDVVKEVFT